MKDGGFRCTRLRFPFERRIRAVFLLHAYVIERGDHVLAKFLQILRAQLGLLFQLRCREPDRTFFARQFVDAFNFFMLHAAFPPLQGFHIRLLPIRRRREFSCRDKEMFG